MFLSLTAVRVRQVESPAIVRGILHYLLYLLLA
jgi:hypothetical protein